MDPRAWPDVRDPGSVEEIREAFGRCCCVNCTISGSLSGASHPAKEICGEGPTSRAHPRTYRRARIGSVVELETFHPRYAVFDCNGDTVAPTVPYLRGLALDDNRPLTGKSYAYDLLRWFRLLWFLDVPWDRASEAEASALVGWLRVAPNPQRRRRSPNAPRPGSVNLRTGKSYLKAGYAPSTINHCLTVVCSFYAYHQHYNRGPLVNPVPESRAQRRALTHKAPEGEVPPFRRARLRQRVRRADPRSVPDMMWDEFFDL